MAEVPDHQTHLKSLVEQQVALSQEIESKRSLLLKVTGAIEYLSEIGVTYQKKRRQLQNQKHPQNQRLLNK